MGLRSATKRRVDRLARVRRVLVLRHDSLKSLAARVGVTPYYLREVFHGNRNASRDLMDKLIGELGVGVWHYVRGMTDTLDVENG